MLCHASTPAVRAVAFPLDEGLDAKGHAAAAAIAQRGFPTVSRVLASPTRRARETAAAMGFAKCDDEIVLRDCDYGRWNGRTLADIAVEEPDAVALWLADPDAAPHDGESISALIDRVAAWIDGADLKGRILAVTHAAVVRAALLHVLDAPAQSFWSIDAGPLSMIELRRNARRWSFHTTQMLPKRKPPDHVVVPASVISDTL